MDAKQSAFSGRMWMVLRFVSAFCMALLVSGCDGSDSSPVGINNETEYEIRRLTDNPGIDKSPSWSPDGRIAFASSRGNENTDIYVMNASGGNLRRLTNHTSQDGDPSWSPDGRSIAFFSLRDDSPEIAGINPEIYVMDADGDNVRRLTNHNAWDYVPSWSPDSRFIAFASRRDDNRDVYVIEVFGRSNRGRRP